jgi:hypothetical protein
MESDGDTPKEKMELVTEAIFDVLYHRGDMEMDELKKHVNAPADIFDMAIGALVEKDDVELLRNGDSVTVHRTSPALAVFPFRSN